VFTAIFALERGGGGSLAPQKRGGRALQISFLFPPARRLVDEKKEKGAVAHLTVITNIVEKPEKGRSG